MGPNKQKLRKTHLYCSFLKYFYDMQTLKWKILIADGSKSTMVC